MSESNRVRIATCRDSAEAAVIRAALSGNDIHVFIYGESSAQMFGLGASAISLDVWVDRDEVEEALALIRELREGGGAQLADDEIPVDDTAEREEDPTDDSAIVAPVDDTLTRLGTRNRVVLAVLIGLFLGHGTAHMSARAWKRGFALAAVQVAGWIQLGKGNVRLGVAVVLATMAMDVLGALMEIAQTSTNLPVATLRRP